MWSSVPLYTVIAGDIVCGTGFLLLMETMRPIPVLRVPVSKEMEGKYTGTVLDAEIK